MRRTVLPLLACFCFAAQAGQLAPVFINDDAPSLMSVLRHYGLPLSALIIALALLGGLLARRVRTAQRHVQRIETEQAVLLTQLRHQIRPATHAALAAVHSLDRENLDSRQEELAASAEASIASLAALLDNALRTSTSDVKQLQPGSLSGDRGGLGRDAADNSRLRTPDTATETQDPALPLPQEMPAFAAAKSAPQILVVEDQPANQFMIELQLKELGYAATVVGDGPTALGILQRTHPFSLALIDCYMPNMGGYELARHIRRYEQEQHLASLPLIAISGATGEEHMIECVESGIDGTLAKPLTLQALQNVLALWLPSPALHPASGNMQVSEHADQSLACVQQEIMRASRQSFHAACTDDLAALRAALELRDLSLAVHYAHRLYGIGLMNDAVSFAQLAHALEVELRGALASFPRWHAQLEEMRRVLPSAASDS